MCVKKHSAYEADERIPSFMLRLALSDIAISLMSDKSQAKDFITLAANHLNVHTDKFEDHRGLQMLKLFDMLEERGIIDPKDSKLPLIHSWLTDVQRNDLLQKLGSYNPYHPIRLVVNGKVQRKL